MPPEIDIPVALLAIEEGKAPDGAGTPEPIYGGYANSRGEVVLFGKDVAYRVNFKNQTLQLRPPLNFGAQARYDETEAGEVFHYGRKTFRRLSADQISDICKSGCFRVSQRQLLF
jgi:hypothetical protein